MSSFDCSVTTARVNTVLPQQSVTESGCVVMAAFRNSVRHEHARTCRSASCSLLFSSLSNVRVVNSFLLSCIHRTTSSLYLACRSYTAWWRRKTIRSFCCTLRFYPHLQYEKTRLFFFLPLLLFPSSSLVPLLHLTPLFVSFNRRVGLDHRKLRLAIRIVSIAFG